MTPSNTRTLQILNDFGNAMVTNACFVELPAHAGSPPGLWGDCARVPRQCCEALDIYIYIYIYK